MAITIHAERFLGTRTSGALAIGGGVLAGLPIMYHLNHVGLHELQYVLQNLPQAEHNGSLGALIGITLAGLVIGYGIGSWSAFGLKETIHEGFASVNVARFGERFSRRI